jgi:hypothetical protein
MKSGSELPSADATASSVVRLLGCTASACLIPRPGGPGSGPVSGRGGASSVICPGRTFRSRGVASSSAGWPGFRRPGRARTKRPAMGTNTRSTSCPWSRSEAGCGGIDCETMVWCIISQSSAPARTSANCRRTGSAFASSCHPGGTRRECPVSSPACYLRPAG